MTIDIERHLNRFQNRRLFGALLSLLVLPILVASDDRLPFHEPSWLIWVTLVLGCPVVIVLMLRTGSISLDFNADEKWRSALFALARLNPKTTDKGTIALKCKAKYLGVHGQNPLLVIEYKRSGGWSETRVIVTPTETFFRQAFVFAPGGWHATKTAMLHARAMYSDVPTLHPWFSKEVVGHTWEHHTKSGDRDYRFKENRKIALVRHYPIQITVSGAPILLFEFKHEAEQDDFVAQFRILTAGNITSLPAVGGPSAEILRKSSKSTEHPSLSC